MERHEVLVPRMVCLGQILSNSANTFFFSSRSSGTVSAGGPSGSLVVNVSPAGLPAGLYLALISVSNTATGAAVPVVVSLSVTPPATHIVLTQHSFVFTVAQGSTSGPSDSFRILNHGQGTMNWQVQAVLPQGNWLRLTPASGSTDAATLPKNAPEVTVQMDPTGLSPGLYGGLLVVTAPGARNNPQFLTVVARILAQGSPPVANVQPAGLSFTADLNGSPVPQTVTVRTTGGATLTFTAGVRTQDGGSWLTVSPSSGSLASSTDRLRVQVQVSPSGLAAGVYQGAVTLSFSNGTVQEVAVAAVVRPAGVTTTAEGVEKPAAGCTPSRQVMVSTRLANNFSLPTAWPVPLAAQIKDDCGTDVTTSTVAASFSNGDPPVVFQNLRNGQHTATWVPTRPGSPQVIVSLRSLNPQLPEATVQLAGTVSTDISTPSVPVINDGGVVNGASFAQFRPLSPGSIFSLFGLSLADKDYQASLGADGKLPTTLGGVKVTIGGIDAPLFYAGTGQINGQVPVELSNVTSTSIAVTARGLISAQRSIQLDATRPGIFFQASATQGAVLNQDFSYNNAANPAARGSVVQIFATGLGPTSPSVATGAPGPSSPPFATVTNSLTVTIGGLDAAVQFQALAPGFVGLYQVNAVVPEGVTPGDAVKLKFTQNGVESNEVTIAVK